jgi:hypothetical protein
MDKYAVQVGIRDTKGYRRFEELDSEDLPLRLGEHELFDIYVPTPQGHKRVRLIAKVEKAR